MNNLNPYDIICDEPTDLSPQLQQEILQDAEVESINEITRKEMHNWLACRKIEWELEHGVPI